MKFKRLLTYFLDFNKKTIFFDFTRFKKQNEMKTKIYEKMIETLMKLTEKIKFLFSWN